METLSDAIQRAYRFLTGRAGSYRRVFNLESQDAQLVLEDLAKFCRAHQPTFDADPRRHALIEGRREVWLRIQAHLNLSNDDLWQLFGGPKQRGE